jgi:DNA invertase Pin-like site-specific DNA recombinase
MLISYARVSTHEQTLTLQQDALDKAGCTKIFTDTASGAKAEHKGLEEALSYVRSTLNAVSAFRRTHSDLSLGW